MKWGLEAHRLVTVEGVYQLLTDFFTSANFDESGKVTFIASSSLGNRQIPLWAKLYRRRAGSIGTFNRCLIYKFQHNIKRQYLWEISKHKYKVITTLNMYLRALTSCSVLGSTRDAPAALRWKTKVYLAETRVYVISVEDTGVSVHDL